MAFQKLRFFSVSDVMNISLGNFIFLSKQSVPRLEFILLPGLLLHCGTFISGGLVWRRLWQHCLAQSWKLSLSLPQRSRRRTISYLDDTFILFDSKHTATQFLHSLNNCHANIKFTDDFKENSTFSFLDVPIKRHNHTFSISIYRKKTFTTCFTGLYTTWDSFTPRKYEVSLIRTLTFRCFRICSSLAILSDWITKEVVVTEWFSCWCYQLILMMFE